MVRRRLVGSGGVVRAAVVALGLVVACSAGGAGNGAGGASGNAGTHTTGGNGNDGSASGGSAGGTMGTAGNSATGGASDSDAAGNAGGSAGAQGGGGSGGCSSCSDYCAFYAGCYSGEAGAFDQCLQAISGVLRQTDARSAACGGMWRDYYSCIKAYDCTHFDIKDPPFGPCGTSLHDCT